ncbi:MAG: tryptophan--tRNA ligase [bacterium]|nr:tryptophan--tRNA ligase [bacterium]
MTKPILVSGIQPSGTLHIGNYLGALKNFVELQNSGKYDCFFFIADLHSLTEGPSPKDQEKSVGELMVNFLAAGLDPKKSTLFLQSRIPEHTELGWIFNTITPMGELERMTQYKDKVSRGISANAGLFDYPVLMAADILIYKASIVPVGDDQDQHLELTRTVARNFNKKFGQTFAEPKAVHTKAPRIMSLDNPEQKMSKSSPKGCLFLTDSPEAIREKIARAVTDSETTIAYAPETRPGVSNLVTIFSEFACPEPGRRAETTPNDIVKKYKGKGYADFKTALAKLTAEKLSMFREKRVSKVQAEKIFISGTMKARKIAEVTLKEAKQKIGLL